MIGRILVGVLVTLTIAYNSGYALVTAADNMARTSMMLFTGMLALATLARPRPAQRLTALDWTVAGLLTGMAFSIVTNWAPGSLSAFLLPVCMVISAYCIVQLVSLSTFVRVFLLSMRLVTATSVLFVSILGGLWAQLPKSTFVNVNGRIYEHIYAYFVLVEASGAPTRNIGVFWEPGVFGSFLVLATFLSIQYMPARQARWDAALFGVGVVTTASTASYLLFVLAIVFLLVRSRNGIVRGVAYVFLLLAALGSLFPERARSLLVWIAPSVFFKLDSANGSFATRLGSPSANLTIFTDYPIFGAGFMRADQLYASMMDSLDLGAQTSTSTYFLASIGILGILYTVAVVVGPMRLSGTPLAGRLALLVALVLIVNKEPHTTILFTWCLLFYLMRGGGERTPENVVLVDRETRSSLGALEAVAPR